MVLFSIVPEVGGREVQHDVLDPGRFTFATRSASSLRLDSLTTRGHLQLLGQRGHLARSWPWSRRRCSGTLADDSSGSRGPDRRRVLGA